MNNNYNKKQLKTIKMIYAYTLLEYFNFKMLQNLFDALFERFLWSIS